MSEMKIRVESSAEAFDRLRDVARRIDSGDRNVREFSLSFATPELMFSALNARRWHLLGVLRRHGPWSIRALSVALGRDYKAVHTDVARLIDAGLIDRSENGLISVPWTRITAELGEEAA